MTGVLNAEEKLEAIAALRKMLDDVPASSADGASSETEPPARLKSKMLNYQSQSS